MSQEYVRNYTVVQKKNCRNTCAVSQKYVRFVGIRALCRKNANEWLWILAYRESARACAREREREKEREREVERERERKRVLHI